MYALLSQRVENTSCIRDFTTCISVRILLLYAQKNLLKLDKKPKATTVFYSTLSATHVKAVVYVSYSMLSLSNNPTICTFTKFKMLCTSKLLENPNGGFDYRGEGVFKTIYTFWNDLSHGISAKDFKRNGEQQTSGVY